MTTPPLTSAHVGRPRSRARRIIYESLVRASLIGCAGFSILTTFAIIVVLFQQSTMFFGVHGDDTPGGANHAQGESGGAFTPPESVRFNEVRINRGEAIHEVYVEIAGPPGETLDDLAYVVIGKTDAGAQGVVEESVDLTGRIGANGLFLLAGAERVYGSRADQRVEGLSLPDEHGTTHLLVRGDAPPVGADLDLDDDGALEERPWSARIDALAFVRNPPSGETDVVYAEATIGPAGAYVPLHARWSSEGGGWIQGDSESTYVSLREFVFGLEWNPLLGAEKHFGIWPLISGTVLVASVAMLVAIPFGLLTAIFLSEYAPRRLRAVLKPVLEVLAGVPTVVYGFFALTVITPALRGVGMWFSSLLYRRTGQTDTGEPVWEPAFFFTDFVMKTILGTEGRGPEHIFGTYNAFGAGLAVGIMTLPIVVSLSEDALHAVPRDLREGAYGLGGTKFDVSVKVVTPAALSGVVAAFLLAIARAVGETMIVALAAGNAARLSLNPVQETQTMTAYMVQIFLGDASNFGPEYRSSYAVGATLFVMTLLLTLVGGRVLAKFREVYE